MAAERARVDAGEAAFSAAGIYMSYGWVWIHEIGRVRHKIGKLRK
jgi:hypothetical protein